MDDSIRTDAEAILSSLGYSLEEGMELFLKLIVKEQGLPNILNEAQGFSYRDAAMSLSGNYLRCYYVDAVTGHYVKYAHEEKIDGKVEVSEGEDFFSYFFGRVTVCVHPADIPMIQKEIDKDSIMKRLAHEGRFAIVNRSFEYSIVKYTVIRVCSVPGKENHFFLGIMPADDQARREVKLRGRIRKAKEAAKIDGLTGVYNTLAYKEARTRIDRKIREGKARFAVVVCDLNNLKLINDTKGHLAGDAYIIEGATRMQRLFAPAKIYRIGGDEFAIILEGATYNDREFLVSQFVDDSIKSLHEGHCVVATGIADFDPKTDRNIASVFLRADMAMYENKQRLKTLKP